MCCAPSKEPVEHAIKMIDTSSENEFVFETLSSIIIAIRMTAHISYQPEGKGKIIFEQMMK